MKESSHVHWVELLGRDDEYVRRAIGEPQDEERVDLVDLSPLVSADDRRAWEEAVVLKNIRLGAGGGVFQSEEKGDSSSPSR